MFDLERSIDAWLKSFRRYRAFNHGSIREMELHIRDHIDDLIAEGKSKKEAFELAVAEFGEINPIAEEEFWNIKRRNTYMIQTKQLKFVLNVIDVGSRLD